MPREPRTPDSLPDDQRRINKAIAKFHKEPMTVPEFRTYLDYRIVEKKDTRLYPPPDYKTILNVIKRMCATKDEGPVITEHDFKDKVKEDTWVIMPEIHGEFACLLTAPVFHIQRDKEHQEALHDSYYNLLQNIQMFLKEAEKEIIAIHPLYVNAFQEQATSELLIERMNKLLAKLHSCNPKIRLFCMNEMIEAIDEMEKRIYSYELSATASDIKAPLLFMEYGKAEGLDDAFQRAEVLRSARLDSLIFQIMKRKLRNTWSPEEFRETCLRYGTFTGSNLLDISNSATNKNKSHRIDISVERRDRNKALLKQIKELLDGDDLYEATVYRVLELVLVDEMDHEDITLIRKEIPDIDTVIGNYPYDPFELLNQLANRFRSHYSKEQLERIRKLKEEANNTYGKTGE